MQWEVCNLAGTVAPLHRQLTLSTNVWHRQQHTLTVKGIQIFSSDAGYFHCRNETELNFIFIRASKVCSGKPKND